MLCEALRQEGVEPAQSIVGVGDVDEFCLNPPVQKGTVDGLCGHDLAHVSDMAGPEGVMPVAMVCGPLFSSFSAMTSAQ